MRTRKQIEDERYRGNVPENENVQDLTLEVLLDIRELLIVSNEHAKEANEIQKQTIGELIAAASSDVA